MSQYERMKKYAVQANSVEDFLQRYTKPNRHEGRGQEYVTARIQSYKDEIAKYGYAFMTHHESKSGEYVTWYPPTAD